MSKVREVYFYASWQEGRGPFEARIITEYNNLDGKRVPVESIDKARAIARRMKLRSDKGPKIDKIETAYGMFFMEEFEDD